MLKIIVNLILFFLALIDLNGCLPKNRYFIYREYEIEKCEMSAIPSELNLFDGTYKIDKNFLSERKNTSCSNFYSVIRKNDNKSIDDYPIYWFFFKTSQADKCTIKVIWDTFKKEDISKRLNSDTEVAYLKSIFKTDAIRMKGDYTEIGDRFDDFYRWCKTNVDNK